MDYFVVLYLEFVTLCYKSKMENRYYTIVIIIQTYLFLFIGFELI